MTTTPLVVVTSVGSVLVERCNSNAIFTCVVVTVSSSFSPTVDVGFVILSFLASVAKRETVLTIKTLTTITAFKNIPFFIMRSLLVSILRLFIILLLRLKRSPK